MKEYTNKKVATFQERFALLCDENSGTLTKLAESLHVSKQTVSAWKNGTRSPKQPTIVAISDYFNITIEWLMGFDVERNRKKKERPVIITDSITFLVINHTYFLFLIESVLVIHVFTSHNEIWPFHLDDL